MVMNDSRTLAEPMILEEAAVLPPPAPADDGHGNAKRRLIQASVICLLFMIFEGVAGLLANSLAILTDAAHLLSDLSSFLISLFAIWISALPGTCGLSFGYHRAEILGACISVFAIWAVTVSLLVSAAYRFVSPQPVDGKLMFITAAFGTAANILMTYILGHHGHGHCHSHGHNHGHSHEHSTDCHAPPPSSQPFAETAEAADSVELAVRDDDDDEKNGAEARAAVNPPCCSSFVQCMRVIPEVVVRFLAKRLNVDSLFGKLANMNLKAAYLHALGDLIQNIGVLIAAGIIWAMPQYSIADPICTVVFAIIVLYTTVSIIKEAISVLMEGTPQGIDVAKLREDLSNLEGVEEVHDLHVWSLSSARPSLVCHVVVFKGRKGEGRPEECYTTCAKEARHFAHNHSDGFLQEQTFLRY
eukprot:Polyplicarium_translucidae@DN2525_c0_g1_i7.p1